MPLQTLTAADVMTRDVATIAPATPVRQIAELLYNRGISGVPVIEKGQVVGVVSEGDLITHAGAIGEQRRAWWLNLFGDESAAARQYARTHGRVARDIMSTNVVAVEETASLAEVARLLERHRIKRVPVLRDGQLVGIVSRRNLLQGLASDRLEAPQTLSDAQILEKVIAELKTHSWAHVEPGEVDVQDGVVRLYGAVRSDDEQRAVRIAVENVAGVKAVEDHRMVRTTPPI